MNKYAIRFNKTRGQPNRGTVDHVWRVFENGKEHLCKDVKINVPSHGQKDGEDWNIACEGYMSIDPKTATATIGNEKTEKDVVKIAYTVHNPLDKNTYRFDSYADAIKYHALVAYASYEHVTQSFNFNYIEVLEDGTERSVTNNGMIASSEQDVAFIRNVLEQEIAVRLAPKPPKNAQPVVVGMMEV
jgi:hypothetical protein